MDSGQFIAIFLVVASSAMLQGVVGLGLNLVAAPLLMMIDPRLVPGPIIVGALLLTILVSLRDRTGVDRRAFTWMALGMLPGAVLAGLLLPVIPVRTLSILLGGLVLAGVGLTRRGVLFAAGFVSGAGSTLASIGGPPVALVNQGMEAKRLRATLSLYFTVLALASIATLIPAGRMGPVEIQFSLAVLPGIVVGFLCSIPLAPRLNQRWSRAAVLIFSASSATLLIVQQILK
jgi:uncharacterized membrane protein YfcA